MYKPVLGMLKSDYFLKSLCVVSHLFWPTFLRLSILRHADSKIQTDKCVMSFQLLQNALCGLSFREVFNSTSREGMPTVV